MNERILIVEDDILVASDMKLMLQSSGYKITGIANSASKALGMFNLEYPDLILCDINLRTKRTGIDFVAKTRKITLVPVIYVTAYADNQTVTKACATAPDSYLVKPFTKTQLLTSVALALEKNKNNIRYDGSVNKDYSPPSEREMDVLQLLNEGLTSHEIADKLNISFQTVQTHRKNLLSKFKVNKTIELLQLAQKFKLIH